jgi:hypothetical protein
MGSKSKGRTDSIFMVVTWLGIIAVIETMSNLYDGSELRAIRVAARCREVSRVESVSKNGRLS